MKIRLTYTDTYHLNARPGRTTPAQARRALIQMLVRWASEWLDGDEDDRLFVFEEILEEGDGLDESKHEQIQETNIGQEG